MREALSKSRKVGIAKVVLKSREHLAAVKSIGNMISLQTMRFAHEIVDANELNLPAKVEVSKKEMDLANMLIDSMADTFEPKKYKDDYYEKVNELIQMKVQGVAPRAAAAVRKAPGKVVDLMEVLKQSLKETKGSRDPVREETSPTGSSQSSKQGRTRKAR
jgi:DNA end-binding protein Ku